MNDFVFDLNLTMFKSEWYALFRFNAQVHTTDSMGQDLR